MKRVVIQVSPESGSTVHPNPGSEPAESASRTASYRLEMILDDQEADSLIANLVRGRPISPTADQDTAEWVEQVVASTGDEAGDLWNQIVGQVERKLLTYVFHECHGVKTKAAARLGINRNTLHKKLCQYSMIEDESGESCSPDQETGSLMAREGKNSNEKD